ncbi:MAG: SRPBCC family protein [Actinomycetes bacterium]
MIVTLSLSVDVDAPPERTWAAATDWDGQSAWMLGTTVRGTARDGQGVGGGIEAFSGVHAGPLRLGVLDTMVVERWEPPWLCHVRHTGPVVRGTGTFAVEPRDGGRSRFVWREDLDLPLGVVGRLGWVLVRPLFAAGVRLSLRRFARWVEAGCPLPG